MKNNYVLIVINDKITKCKVIETYSNNTMRIKYPTYCNGKYNGYEETTINQNKVVEYYEPQNEKWYTKEELINIIINNKNNENINDITRENAENEIEYSIKHSILYDYDGYIKHFAQYEN